MFKLLDFLLALVIFAGIVSASIVYLAPAHDDGWGYELTLAAVVRDRK